ncbi:tRNA lysidine(34) synthetase TilS [Cucumibacter marinus]|uniref:tRNA lysidine(34) synthetase TilS n=1 Tax=Cucumibacter marinus TaxID=1121252 RepID=UPI00041477F3|nr:tRNA lysidine(34) synthetase TilS [Cucumibacter marinus]
MAGSAQTSNQPDDDALAALFAPVADEGVLALAVSGGADSLALMILAARWRDTRPEPPAIFVFTVDHGLRAEAAAECAMVLGRAAELGLEAETLHWEEGAATSTGIQAKARKARYALMKQAMAVRGISHLMTGHHFDDQAETVLMRLARGSGLTGVSGMRGFAEVEGVSLFRPLLGLRRDELEAIVRQKGWLPAADPSNEDEHYERVRWRKAMPGFAETGLTPERLVLFAGRAARADEALDFYTERAFTELVAVDGFGCAAIEREALSALPKETCLRLIARVCAEAGGVANAPDLSQIEALCASLCAGVEFAGETLGGCQILEKDRWVLIHREAGRVSGEEITVSPGDRLVWDGRFMIALEGEGALTLRSGQNVTRSEAEMLAGRGIVTAIGALQAAPAAYRGDTLVGIGPISSDPALTMQTLMGAHHGPRQ